MMFYIKQVSLLALGFLFIKGPSSHKLHKQVRTSPRHILHATGRPFQLAESLGNGVISSKVVNITEEYGKAKKDTSESLVGKQAPDFKLTSFDGETLSLHDFKGKVVILDFWATWCKPCLVELPNVQKVYQDFKKEGLVVLGMNAEKISKAQAFMKKHNYTFINLHDSDRRVAHEKYYVNAIPSVFIIDRKGQISSYLVGTHSESELRKAVQKAGL